MANSLNGQAKPTPIPLPCLSAAVPAAAIEKLTSLGWPSAIADRRALLAPCAKRVMVDLEMCLLAVSALRDGEGEGD